MGLRTMALVRTESEALRDGEQWFDIAFNTWSGAALVRIHCPHLGLLILFMALTFTYSVFAFVQYFTRPTAEVFAFKPMDREPVQLVTLSTSCSTPWACHSNASRGTDGWQWDGVPSIHTRYGNSRSACKSSTVALPADDSRLRGTFTLPLCFSDAGEDGIVLDIPAFSSRGGCTYGAEGCRPFLRVEITSAPAMNMTIDVEPFQRKTVYIGLVTRADHTRAAEGFLMFRPKSLATSYEPYVADLFYDGKNVDSAARLQLRMRQFAEGFEVSRPGTLDQVLGEIGGFEGLVLMMMSACAGCASLLMRLCRTPSHTHANVAHEPATV